MQKYTITRNLPNFCVHIFVLPAFSLSFSIKILIFVQSYLFFSIGCTVWCAKIEYPNSEAHVCNRRALVFTTTETTGTTVWFWTLCCQLTTTKTTFTSLKAGCHLRLVVPVVSVVFQKPQADCCAHAAACKVVPRLDQSGLNRRPACKAVLSEASVTRDTVPGLYATGENCL